MMRHCECGCGSVIPIKDAKGRFLRFKSGHQNRLKTTRQIAAASKTLSRVRLRIPWNKDRTYVIAKRSVYANKGSLQMAMRRLFSNCCMICGWNLAPCDSHHVVPRSLGGKHTLENAVLLCPNCHRLVHCGQISNASLYAARKSAKAVNPMI